MRHLKMIRHLYQNFFVQSINEPSSFVTTENISSMQLNKKWNFFESLNRIEMSCKKKTTLTSHLIQMRSHCMIKPRINRLRIKPIKKRRKNPEIRAWTINLKEEDVYAMRRIYSKNSSTSSSQQKSLNKKKVSLSRMKQDSEFSKTLAFKQS